MDIITDSPDFTEKFLNKRFNWIELNKDDFSDGLLFLSGEIFKNSEIKKSVTPGYSGWRYLFITESSRRSQFDILSEVCRENSDIKDHILCVADSGDNFHGFKERKWHSLPGNLHLSVLLSPQKKIENFASASMMLAAVSVTETIQSIKGIEHIPSIKWVNDIILNNSKISGVITQAQIEGDLVKNIELGIGLNILSTPQIEFDSVVPSATSLIDNIRDKKLIRTDVIFNTLCKILYKNYELLLNDGVKLIYKKYLENSFLLGKKIKIIPDDEQDEFAEFYEGVVEYIDENLEIKISGFPNKISKGKIILTN